MAIASQTAGAIVGGAAVVGAAVVGAAVVGAEVVGAAVVGGTVVGAAVVGGIDPPQAVGAAIIDLSIIFWVLISTLVHHVPAIHQLLLPTWLYLAK